VEVTSSACVCVCVCLFFVVVVVIVHIEREKIIIIKTPNSSLAFFNTRFHVWTLRVII